MGSGKSTISKYLTAQYGHRPQAMAGWLKGILCRHYGLATLDKSLVIKGKSMRTLMQQLGNGLRAVDPDWHIDEVAAAVRNTACPCVIDDVRFTNEINCLTKAFKCATIKVSVDDTEQRLIRCITRDGIIPDAVELADISERDIDDLPYDYLLRNDGTIDDLRRNTHLVMEQIHGTHDKI